MNAFNLQRAEYELDMAALNFADAFKAWQRNRNSEKTVNGTREAREKLYAAARALAAFPIARSE